jgi:hypothetical protein
MERIISENMINLSRENYVAWYEQFETIALHYGEAGRAWKNVAPYEPVQSTPDDKNVKTRYSCWTMSPGRRISKNIEQRIKPCVVC